MKKLIFLIPMLLFGLVLFAQDVPDIPDKVSDFLDDPGRFLKQLAGIVGLTIFVVGNFILWFGMEKRWAKVVVSVLVALAVSLLTNAANYGLFAESAYIDTCIWGAGIGVAAGGVVDIPTMKILVNLILSIIRFKKPE